MSALFPGPLRRSFAGLHHQALLLLSERQTTPGPIENPDPGPDPASAPYLDRDP